MSETEPIGISPKRFFRMARIAFALGIICIILVVGLIVVYASMMNTLENTLEDKDNTIRSLNDQIYYINGQLGDLNDTLSMGKGVAWVSQQNVSQPAGSYTSMNFTAPYCGYIIVTIDYATTNNTYVRVIMSSDRFPVSIDEQNNQTFENPHIIIPVLYLSNIEVRIGNNNTDVGATETVTIQYYY